MDAMEHVREDIFVPPEHKLPEKITLVEVQDFSAPVLPRSQPKYYQDITADQLIQVLNNGSNIFLAKLDIFAPLKTPV